MSGERGDRRSPGALRGDGGRHARLAPVIRARAAELIGLDGVRIAFVTMVTDDHAPACVMFEGEPFLRVNRVDVLAYQQTRPYRADCMVIEDFGA
jgi:hypothetical protein